MNHSKAKLALAVLTSPSAAFEEIIERRLLGTGLVIVAVTGAVSCLKAAIVAQMLGPVHYFSLGRNNPLAWFGLFLLYALALKKLLKWIGTEIDYQRLLIVMGWSQVALLVSQVLTVVGTVVAISGAKAGSILQLVGAISQVLQIGYAALVGVGIHVASNAPIARGIMSYVVVSLAAWIGFAYTYVNSRLKLFENALPGIAIMAQQLIVGPDPLTIAAPDSTPWLGASVVGLILGLRQLGKDLGWSREQALKHTVTVGLVGAAVFGIYLNAFLKADYYGRLIAAQRDYDLEKFDRAAQKLISLIPASRVAAGSLTLEVADIYYLAHKPKLSLRYYRKFAASLEKHKSSTQENEPLARALSGIGAVYDQEGKYNLALKQFKAATKAWPNFRDPWVRMAITYSRIGQHRAAIENAEHAVKKLESKAAVAYVVLTEAYARIGNLPKAEAAFKELKKIDDELAARIGTKPNDWKYAVNKLTAKDLKFPLEKEVAPLPQKSDRDTRRK